MKILPAGHYTRVESSVDLLIFESNGACTFSIFFTFLVLTDDHVEGKEKEMQSLQLLLFLFR